jgi:peptidyl-tRNA hydrolase
MQRDADIQAMLDERNRTMAEFTPDHRPIKMYAIFDKSLEMSPSKLSAQTGHAFCLALKEARKKDPDIEDRYMGTGNGTKVLMYAKNESGLIRAFKEAKAAGFPCALIIDRGHVLLPHFDGNAIITAVGIGPVYEDEARAITKRYTLDRTPFATAEPAIAV